MNAFNAAALPCSRGRFIWQPRTSRTHGNALGAALPVPRCIGMGCARTLLPRAEVCGRYPTPSMRGYVVRGPIKKPLGTTSGFRSTATRQADESISKPFNKRKLR